MTITISKANELITCINTYTTSESNIVHAGFTCVGIQKYKKLCNERDKAKKKLQDLIISIISTKQSLKWID